MAETVFLSENNVQVTNARFIVSGQTYAMTGITSVKNAKQNPSRTLPIILGLIGLGLLGAAPFAGILAIGIAVAIFVMSKSKHTVVLHTSGGQVEALSSTDTDHIVRIIAALNDAIIHRG